MSTEKNSSSYDLLIIGSGIAGMTAAIYAARARLNFLIIEKYFPGGQGMLTDRIENYPGFNTISGAELMHKINQQIEQLGASIITEEVLTITPGEQTHKVKTTESTYNTKHILIATGAVPKKLGIPGEEKLTGQGVSYCGTCDAAFFPDKDVLVIGGGDTALEEALFISKFAKSVSLVHRRDQFRAVKILVDEAASNNKINFVLSSTVKEIIGDTCVQSALIEDLRKGTSYRKEVEGVFIFVGYSPQSTFLNSLVKVDANGYIITDEFLETSVPRIFAAGDIRHNPLKQLITAAGEGALAGHMITKRITGYN